MNIIVTNYLLLHGSTGRSVKRVCSSSSTRPRTMPGRKICGYLVRLGTRCMEIMGGIFYAIGTTRRVGFDAVFVTNYFNWIFPFYTGERITLIYQTFDRFINHSHEYKHEAHYSCITWSFFFLYYWTLTSNNSIFLKPDEWPISVTESGKNLRYII